MGQNNNVKEDILNVSKNLFYENGFEKTTIRMIAKELDMFHANIFYYFKNKKEILKFIFKEYYKSIYEQVLNLDLNLTNIELLLAYSYISLKQKESDVKFRRLYYEATEIIIEVLYEGYVKNLYPKIDTNMDSLDQKKQNEYFMDIIVILSSEKQIEKFRENKLLNISTDDFSEYMTRTNLKLLDIDAITISNSQKTAASILDKIDFKSLNIFRPEFMIIFNNE